MLVDIVAAMGLPHGKTLEKNTEQGYPEHTLGTDLLRIGQTLDTLNDDDDAAHGEHDGINDSTCQHMILLLEQPRKTQCQRTA